MRLCWLLAMAAVATTTAAADAPTTSPAVQALRAAVARGRTPPAAVVDRPGAPLPGRREEQLDGVTATDLDLLVDADAWLPLTLFTPPAGASSPPYPLLLLLHATGADRDKMRGRALAAARRGYAVVTPDVRFHGGWLTEVGDKADANDVADGQPPPARGPRQYVDALIAAYKANGTTHPFLLDNVWDLQRVLDWVERKQTATIDIHRVGATGVSLGGMHAWLLAAADPRVAVAAPMIGVQSFAYEADHDAWQARASSVAPLLETAAAPAKPTAATFRNVFSTLAPGLLTAYDAPQSVPTIAPRPFLAVNGELDPRCPLAGVRAAMAAAAEAYAAAGRPDAVKLYVAEGVDHTTTPDMWREVDAWLDRWLLGREAAG